MAAFTIDSNAENSVLNAYLKGKSVNEFLSDKETAFTALQEAVDTFSISILKSIIVNKYDLPVFVIFLKMMASAVDSTLNPEQKKLVQLYLDNADFVVRHSQPNNGLDK